MTPTIAHDAAGNMTRVPIPGDWQDNRLGDFELTFDAWNRLVAVDDGSESECEVADVIEKRSPTRSIRLTPFIHYPSPCSLCSLW